MNVQQPADAAIRERALDPSRSFIVQAPAGSGKTELLTRRYLRLLAVVERPEEILAITFTRKAAAEMRTRVLKALDLGTQAAPPEPHRIATWELARAALAADAEKGWRLQSHPARLKIQTIDALNHSLARNLPILAGTGAAIRIAEDSEPLYAEAVLRVVEHMGSRTQAADAVERLVKHLDNRLDSFTSLLTNLLKRRDHWLDLDLLHGDREQLRQRLEEALSAAVTERLRQLAALWPPDTEEGLTTLAAEAAGRLSMVAPDEPLVACQSLAQFPQGSVSDLAVWQGFASLLLTDKGLWRKRLTKDEGFPPEPKKQKQAMLALLAFFTDVDAGWGGELSRRLHEARQLPAARYSFEQWAALEALLEVLKIAVAELELVFRERGVADHVAAALAGRRALGSADNPTDLALKLDYRLKHLLIDEFQDTSRSQIQLLKLLTAGWSPDDGRSLFLVGDPMQSIYRFREADVGLFLKLKEAGLNDLPLESLTLTVNFRSTQPVIRWVNEAFRRVLPMQDDPERGAVCYTASEARPGAAETGGIIVHPLVGSRDATQEAEAQQIAQLVLEKQARDPQATIAILVASRAHLAHILPELAAHRIPYQAVEIDRLRDRPIVRDLLALTRALVHLADRTAWLAVLRAPWCGLTLSDLHALAAETPHKYRSPPTIWSLMNEQAIVDSLTDDGRQRLLHAREVIGLALAERGRQPLRDWVERAWHALYGPATARTESELEDAEAYLARLDRLERAGDLEDVARLELEIADLYAAPVAGSATSSAIPPVEVMTLHKAKGLEFGTVILPALERTPPRDDARLLRWLEIPRADDAPTLLVAPLAARDEDADPLHEWLKSIERERANFERGRQLYVGATRAVRELHLFGAVMPEESEDAELPVKAPSTHSFLGLLWPIVQEQFATAAPVAESPGATRETKTALRRLPRSWKPELAELPGLDAAVVPEVIEGSLTPEFDWVSETSRQVGTLVHRELERLARSGLDGTSVPDKAAELHYEQELAGLGVPALHRKSAAARVAAALTNLLTDERGRWVLGGAEVHKEATSELALSGFIGKAFVNGVIDRTFVDANGTRWIVDFKTSVHTGAGLDEFFASEVERYRPQMDRYAALMRAWRPEEPVRAALYFPLLKAWREVDVSN